MNVITCKGLTKFQGKHKTLNNLTFDIKENTITGLIGRNGSGKTTLLKVIAGLWRETSGQISVFRNRPFNNLTVSANTIFVDDQMSFTSSLTLIEILKQMEQFYEKWDVELANRLFDYFSFDPKQIHENLSKGKKSTFNMIIGLAAKCALTIFDEPTTGMDAAVRNDFYRALLKDYLTQPRTIIISSHYLDEIENLLEDILLIENGKKHLHLPMDEMKEYALGITGKTAIVMQWIGEKEVIETKTDDADNTYVVMRNNLSKETIEQAKRLGMNISPVSPSDLCLYLTNNKKGGIDGVFNKR